MSSISFLQIHMYTTGDVILNQLHDIAPNLSSPVQVDLLTFTNGGHIVDPPIISGYTVVGVLIVPPPDNPGQIVLKSVLEDNGIILHPTNPTFLSLGQPSAPSTLYIDYAGTGSIKIRFIWI